MFQRGSATVRWLAEASVEATAEAWLGTPGDGDGIAFAPPCSSERRLRRIRFGMAAVVPLRIGMIFAAVHGGYTKGVDVGVEFGALGVGVGDEPLAISVWRSPMTRSMALAANSFTFD